MNIAEVLKKCPKGTKLYSPIFGELELHNVVDNEKYPITCRTKTVSYELFTSDGKYFLDYPDAECVLFPSKDQRDWSKFGATDQKPKTELKPFDKVLVRNCDIEKWKCNMFSHIDGYYVCFSSYWHQCIPYEDNKHLLGTSNKPE